MEYGGWDVAVGFDPCSGGHPGSQHTDDAGETRCNRCGREIDLTPCGHVGHGSMGRSYCAESAMQDRAEARIALRPLISSVFLTGLAASIFLLGETAVTTEQNLHRDHLHYVLETLVTAKAIRAPGTSRMPSLPTPDSFDLLFRAWDKVLSTLTVLDEESGEPRLDSTPTRCLAMLRRNFTTAEREVMASLAQVYVTTSRGVASKAG